MYLFDNYTSADTLNAPSYFNFISFSFQFTVASNSWETPKIPMRVSDQLQNTKREAVVGYLVPAHSLGFPVFQ